MSWPVRTRGGKSGVRSRMAWPPMSRSGTLRSAARRAVRAAVSKVSFTARRLPESGSALRNLTPSPADVSSSPRAEQEEAAQDVDGTDEDRPHDGWTREALAAPGSRTASEQRHSYQGCCRERP